MLDLSTSGSPQERLSEDRNPTKGSSADVGSAQASNEQVDENVLIVSDTWMMAGHWTRHVHIIILRIGIGLRNM